MISDQIMHGKTSPGSDTSSGSDTSLHGQQRSKGSPSKTKKMHSSIPGFTLKQVQKLSEEQVLERKLACEDRLRTPVKYRTKALENQDRSNLILLEERMNELNLQHESVLSSLSGSAAAAEPQEQQGSVAQGENGGQHAAEFDTSAANELGSSASGELSDSIKAKPHVVPSYQAISGDTTEYTVSFVVEQIRACQERLSAQDQYASEDDMRQDQSNLAFLKVKSGELNSSDHAALAESSAGTNGEDQPDQDGSAEYSELDQDFMNTSDVDKSGVGVEGSSAPLASTLDATQMRPDLDVGEAVVPSGDAQARPHVSFQEDEVQAQNQCVYQGSVINVLSVAGIKKLSDAALHEFGTETCDRVNSGKEKYENQASYDSDMAFLGLLQVEAVMRNDSQVPGVRPRSSSTVGDTSNRSSASISPGTNGLRISSSTGQNNIPLKGKSHSKNWFSILLKLVFLALPVLMMAYASTKGYVSRKVAVASSVIWLGCNALYAYFKDSPSMSKSKDSGLSAAEMMGLAASTMASRYDRVDAAPCAGQTPGNLTRQDEVIVQFSTVK